MTTKLWREYSDALTRKPSPMRSPPSGESRDQGVDPREGPPDDAPPVRETFLTEVYDELEAIKKDVFHAALEG